MCIFHFKGYFWFWSKKVDSWWKSIGKSWLWNCFVVHLKHRHWLLHTTHHMKPFTSPKPWTPVPAFFFLSIFFHFFLSEGRECVAACGHLEKKKKGLHPASIFRVVRLCCAAAASPPPLRNLCIFQKDAGVVTVAPFQATNHGAEIITKHPSNQENGVDACYVCDCLVWALWSVRQKHRQKSPLARQHSVNVALS